MSRALIIDDDPTHHYLAKTMLNHFGFFEDYKCYTDPKSALIDLIDAYHASKSLPDVILLDLKMPDLNGWEFLEMFDNFRTIIGRDIPVFIITSSIDPNDEAKSYTYSAVKGFFTKPLSPEILKAVSVKNVA